MSTARLGDAIKGLNDEIRSSVPPTAGGPQCAAGSARPSSPVEEPWTSWGRSSSAAPGGIRLDIEAVLGGQPVALLWLEAFAFIALVAVVDGLTGSELSLSLFYLVPVIFATWFISRTAGIVVGLVSLGTWVYPDLVVAGTSTQLLVWAWNTGLRSGFFLIVLQLVYLMKAAKAHEASLARTDSLTGVANGRSFSDRAEFELAAVRRTGHPLTMAYIDLDRFKHINDTLGHTEGDRLLKASAAAIENRMRATDLVARLGGDEFGVLLPDTDSASAPAVLAAISEAITGAIDGAWDAGCTIGAVTFERAPESVDFMVRTADELMYRGKRAGRGRVEHAVWPRRVPDAGVEAPATC